MNKILLVFGVVVVVLVGGFFWLNGYIYQEKQGPTDYKDATYIIAGQPVTLVNGYAESEAAPDSTRSTSSGQASSPQAGSASKTITRFFGNEAKGDLDGDDLEDIAFLLTQESSGSGTFFYVVAALQTPAGTYNGSHAVLLGDRVAPQTTEYHGFSGIPGGYIIVNYADRAPGEPMTAQPSQGKSIWLKLDPATMQFGEIVQDFEGEADPSRMTLGMKTWDWVSALYNDGRTLAPKQAGKFTLTFDETKKTVSIGTDCNSGNAPYTVADGTISFGAIASTLMFCAESQETEFFELIANSSGYHFTSRGQLILDLKYDSGTVTFR